MVRFYLTVNDTANVMFCKDREVMFAMLMKEITKLKNKINNLIANDADKDQIYRVSVELDELIARYYGIKKK